MKNEPCYNGRQPGPSWLRKLATTTAVGKFLVGKLDVLRGAAGGEQGRDEGVPGENLMGGSRGEEGSGKGQRKVTEKQLVHLGEKIVRIRNFARKNLIVKDLLRVFNHKSEAYLD